MKKQSKVSVFTTSGAHHLASVVATRHAFSNAIVKSAAVAGALLVSNRALAIDWHWADAASYSYQDSANVPSPPGGVSFSDSKSVGLDYVPPPASFGTPIPGTGSGNWSAGITGALIVTNCWGANLTVGANGNYVSDPQGPQYTGTGTGPGVFLSSSGTVNGGVVAPPASIGVTFTTSGAVGAAGGTGATAIIDAVGAAAAGFVQPCYAPTNPFGGPSGTSGTGGSGGGGGWDGGFGAGPGGSGGIPNGSCAVAVFTSAGAGAVTIPSGGRTAGTFAISSTSAYSFSGDALTLACSSGDVSLQIDGGVTHSMSNAINVNNDLHAYVGSGTTFAVSGTPTFVSGVQFTKGGTGQLSLPRFTAPKLVLGGGTLKSTASSGTASRAGEFAIGRESSTGNAGVLNLSTAGAGFVADVPDAATALARIQFPDAAHSEGWIRAAIRNGFTGGTWSGATNSTLGSITSSAATANNQLGIGYATSAQLLGSSGGTFLGQSVDGSTVLLRVTYRGDSNLNGYVDFDDYVPLSQNYNGTGKTWTQGDFDYDGDVDFDDLTKLSQNYQSPQLLTEAQVSMLTSFGGAQFAHDLALAQALAPEPAILGSLGMIGMFVRRRR